MSIYISYIRNFFLQGEEGGLLFWDFVHLPFCLESIKEPSPWEYLEQIKQQQQMHYNINDHSHQMEDYNTNV